MIKPVCIDKIKDQKKERDDCIVDAILEKWVCRGCQKPEMLAEQNKTADIPAHNEHAHRYANDRGAYGIHISEIFGGKIQSVRAKRFHKGTTHCTEQDKPE